MNQLVAANKNWLLYIKFLILSMFIIITVHPDYFINRFSEISVGFYGPIGIAIFIGIWLLCLGALIITAILPNRYIRIFLSIIIVVATFSDAVYQKISNHEINYDILQLLWESRHFAGDAFSFYKGEMGWTAVVALLGALGLLLPDYGLFTKINQKFPRLLSKPATYLYALSPYLVLFALILVQGGTGTGGLPFQYKTTSLFAMMLINDLVVDQQRISSGVSIPLQASRFGDKKPNILLIIDESVRGDYIDINNNLGTTPHLYAQKDRLVNFGYAGSVANCSQTTNQIIRIGASSDPEKFNKSLQNNPYIWQYAKQAGYKTIMIDSQVKPGEMNNRLSKAEVAMLDEFHYVEGASSREKDIKAGQLIKKLLADQQNKQPHLIFLVKSGVHFPYEERYPKENAKFMPDRSLGEPLDSVEKLVNSYKNILLWVTDSAFEDFFKETQFMDSIVIYTSDHGQSLLDRGIKLSHCSTEDVSLYEGLVPLFVLTDNPTWKAIFAAAALKNKNKASHFNLVPTMLDIFGYDVSQRMAIHGESLLDDLHEPRRFISGFITLSRLSLFSRNKVKWHVLPETWKTAD